MKTQIIKNILTTDDMISLLEYYGISPKQYNNKYLIFPSICHHPNDYHSHKPKLYYYVDNKSFHCYSCGFHGDVFSLVQKLSNLSFGESLRFVCKQLNLNVKETVEKEKDNWQSLKNFLPNYEEIKPLTIYDQQILKLFENKFYQPWIEYGISEQTLKKYQIGFYNRLSQITIPVFYNKDLIGIRIRTTTKKDSEKGKYRPLIDLNKTIYKFPTNQVFYGWDENQDVIKDTKEAWIVEGEKTVLKFDTWGYKNCLAVFGSNISKEHIKKLVNLGVDKIVLMIDSDFHLNNTEEFNMFANKIKKLSAKLKPYFTLAVVYNNIGIENAYKFSPTDFTREQFENILEKCVKMY